MEEYSKKESNMPIWLVVLGILIISGIAVYLARGREQSASNLSSTSSIEAENTQTDVLMANTQNSDVEVQVEGGMFYFNPNEIRVKSGETVKIVLTSVEGMHDFVIDNLGVATNAVNKDGTTEVIFTAPVAGEYEFYCSIGNHKAMGMTGRLVVE